MINIDDRILSEVDENQLFLLCAIAKHMGNNAKAWPSNRSLCETTRWSPNKLQRVKKSAIEAGILGAESRFQKAAQTSNLYQIKTRRIGVMVNLADITPHPQNGVPPHPQNDTPAPPQNRVPPHPQNGGTEVLTNEVLTNEREGERTPPAPNPSNLQSQKKENGLVPPAENPETVKAEIPPSKKVAPKKDSPEKEGWPTNCEFCEGSGMKILGGRKVVECSECDGSGVATFKVTAIASPTDLPGVTIVEAAPKLQPLPRVATTIEAETKISEWIAGEGLETVKHRFSIAKQRFDPDNAAAIAAHYCSVYTKSAANKGRLLADPITHFSDGLFSYLKNEESFGRNNAPKEGSPTRNQTPPANFQTSTRY